VNRHKIFITGASGLLGTNLCNYLLEQGFEVKAQVRDTRRYTGLLHPRLELIKSGLFADFSPLLQDVDCVIHTAAVTDQNVIDPDAYRRINYHASVQLFHAAAKSQVRHFIYVSTANTLGFGSLEQPGTEDTPISGLFQKSGYAKSKLETENYLLHKKDQMVTTIVHPTFMIGPYDTKPSSGKIILRGLRKRILFYPPGGKNFVHVRDVYHGIMRCIPETKTGQRYLLAHENMSYRAFYEKLNQASHQRPVMIKVPQKVLLLAGFFGDLIRRFGVKTPLSSNNVKSLCIYNYYSNQKSASALKLYYTPIDTAIKEAVCYFQQKS